MPMRYEIWSLSAQDLLHSLIEDIKQARTIGGLPSRQYGQTLNLEKVRIHNAPGVWDHSIDRELGVKEFGDKLGGIVSLKVRGNDVKRTLKDDGSTVIIPRPPQIISVTLFQAGGPFDSGDEPGDFGYTTVL